MKKVGIVTLYGENNYGNRLQNYAVYKTLKKLDLDPCTIVPQRTPTIKGRVKKITKEMLCKFFRGYALKKRPSIVRTDVFKKFTKKYIPTKYVYSKNGLLTNKLAEKYDMFVVGSDQVWNPTFEFFKDEYHNLLLSFAPFSKRYSFSPSIGVKNVPDEWKNIFKAELSGFMNLCSREDSGRQAIAEITGREDVITTIDPTLMLSQSEWLEISSKVEDIPDNYSLDYFLGETPEEDEHYIKIKNEMSKIKMLKSEELKYYICGPSEFIFLVSKARLICTDSFHACVFSILFSKPFVIYKRNDSNKDMFSRLETLLQMFDIDINQNIGKTIYIDAAMRDAVLDVKRKDVINIFGNLNKE